MKRNQLLITLLFLLFLTVISAFGFQTKLVITDYTIYDSRIPSDLDGYVIIQISDFHNAEFGDGQNQIISAIASRQPDLILLTGDMINKNDDTFLNTQIFLEKASTLAPIYSVAGNHEYMNFDKYMELVTLYKDLGITILADESASLSVNNTEISIYGINQEHYHDLQRNDISQVNIPNLDDGQFGILLYHFANQFDTLSQINTDYFCVFSGHTHGGIIRFPFIGGIISNDGTFFPKYSHGLYNKNSLYLISSSGLGDAFLPRFNNNPEIVCVTLHHQ